MQNLQAIEQECREWLTSQADSNRDSAHDIAHIERVVENARRICEGEQADSVIVMTAAWLHDCVIVPKNHPDRKKASTFAAEKAAGFLSEIDFPANKIPAVAHAIETHSYSAGLTPGTIEAKIVQDADRLDALGAIGIARCFLVGGEMKSAIYHPEDPFGASRSLDDSKWTIDHFYIKLFKLPGLLHTSAAKRIAERRIDFMKQYLSQLSSEIGSE